MSEAFFIILIAHVLNGPPACHMPDEAIECLSLTDRLPYCFLRQTTTNSVIPARRNKRRVGAVF